MICADTSSLIAFMANEPGRDVDLIRATLIQGTLVLAPVAVSEVLSDSLLLPALEGFVLDLPQLEISPGYWERAGRLRASLMRHRYRPKLADTLIAQSCLDHSVPLVTRDRDFLAFHKIAGLELIASPSRVQ